MVRGWRRSVALLVAAATHFGGVALRAQAPAPVPSPPAPAPTPAPAPAPADAAKPVWYTQFGAQVLAKVDAVVVGKVVEVTGLRGTDVVRVEIVAWKHGARPKGLRGDVTEVTLLAAPGDYFVGTEQLLFLALFEKGPRYTAYNRVARSDPDWDAKLGCLDKNLALLALEKPEERRREARKLLYDDLASTVHWTRWHAYHELLWVRENVPTLVTREDRDDLRKAANASDDAKLKELVLKLLQEWER